MCRCDRRAFIGLASGGLICLVTPPGPAAGSDQARFFIAEAQRMRQRAIAAGDQPFGAIVVRNGMIAGYGPSRVILDRNPDAHAERVAIGDAQNRLGSKDLSGAVMYSTSRPCQACEDAAAEANLERMRFGASAADAGMPRRR